MNPFVFEAAPTLITAGMEAAEEEGTAAVLEFCGDFALAAYKSIIWRISARLIP